METPVEKALIAQIVSLVELKELRTSPVHLGTERIVYEAGKVPGMKVYFSVHKSYDERVGQWVSLTYPGRSTQSPGEEVLRNIVAQLSKNKVATESTNAVL